MLVPVLMLVGAGILGLHPVYYALAQDLPSFPYADYARLLLGTCLVN